MIFIFFWHVIFLLSDKLDVPLREEPSCTRYIVYICHGFYSSVSYLQIAPADLEAVLISHPEILDVGVTGYEH